MAANYLHGVETIEVTKGGRPVKLVKSSVIGLVGTAPIHHVATAKRSIDRPVQVLSDKDAVASFGPELTGYTIPQALERVRKCGRGVAIVVNVFDPARHYIEVTDEALALPASGTTALAHADIISLTLTVASSGVALVAGSDYELEPITGTIRRLSGSAIPAATGLLASYRYANPGAITAGDIIGTVNAAGLRTGMQAWLDSYSQFGYFPKNLIAPAYGSLAAVRAELDILARRLRSHAFVDAPVGTSFTQALAERGPAGTIFNTSSERVVLCWPHVQEYDAVTDSIILAPLSCYAAGVMAETDIAEGYWVSPSNHEIPGIVGLETPVTAMINDPNSEANLLNEAGIMTVFNAWGSGFRLWGNRSAAFPSSTVATNFIAVRRTLDVIHESVEYAMLQFLDRPLDAAIIDAILATVNALVRKLIADGALIDGRYRFDPAENTEEELSAGHLVLTDDLTPPSPLERLTFKSSYSTAGLRALYTALAA